MLIRSKYVLTSQNGEQSQDALEYIWDTPGGVRTGGVEQRWRSSAVASEGTKSRSAGPQSANCAKMLRNYTFIYINSVRLKAIRFSEDSLGHVGNSSLR